MIDSGVRRLAKDFCKAIRSGEEFTMSEADRKPWMPRGRPRDELICMQKNRRKDGSLFNNLFYMKVFHLSVEFGESYPYVVALQSEIKDGMDGLLDFVGNLNFLDSNMAKVRKELSAVFYMQCTMDRQLRTANKDDSTSDERC